jgi:hypothetical protein
MKLFPLPGDVDPVAGEPLRYMVRSRTRRGQKFLVDLGEWGAHGICSCEHFEYRLLPQLRADRDAGAVLVYRRCWHIRQALDFHAALSVRVIAATLAKRQRSNDRQPYETIGGRAA